MKCNKATTDFVSYVRRNWRELTVATAAYHNVTLEEYKRGYCKRCIVYKLVNDKFVRQFYGHMAVCAASLHPGSLVKREVPEQDMPDYYRIEEVNLHFDKHGWIIGSSPTGVPLSSSNFEPVGGSQAIEPSWYFRSMTSGFTSATLISMLQLESEVKQFSAENPVCPACNADLGSVTSDREAGEA